jgi:hypothetical protein
VVLVDYCMVCLSNIQDIHYSFLCIGSISMMVCWLTLANLRLSLRLSNDNKDDDDDNDNNFFLRF